MRAIVDINGKQYEVEEGRYVQIDSYNAPENQEVVLGNVRLVIAGEQSLIGVPYVEGATVKTKVKRHGRGPKVLVYKMRCKKGYRRKNGHRQGFTELQVELIDFKGRDAFGAVPQAQAPVARPAAKSAQAAVEAPAKTESKPQKAKAETANVEAPAKEAKPKAKKAATGEAKKAKAAEPTVEEVTKPVEAPVAEAPAVEETAPKTEE